MISLLLQFANFTKFPLLSLLIFPTGSLQIFPWPGTDDPFHLFVFPNIFSLLAQGPEYPWGSLNFKFIDS